MAPFIGEIVGLNKRTRPKKCWSDGRLGDTWEIRTHTSRVSVRGFQTWLGQEGFELMSALVSWWTHRSRHEWEEVKGSGAYREEIRHWGACPSGTYLALGHSCFHAISWKPWVEQLCSPVSSLSSWMETSETMSQNKQFPLRWLSSHLFMWRHKLANSTHTKKTGLGEW
jgi:hypothetical protein